MPDRPAFGGGATETVMHPAVLAAMLLTALLMLILPRRRLLAPFLMFVVLAPFGQQLYIGGVHWFAPRVIVLLGCLRILARKLTAHETIFPNGLNGIDHAFLIWAFFRGLAPILLYRSGGIVPGQLNFWLGAFGGYFFLRYLIQDTEDITKATKTLALLAVAVGICMANERFRNINIFGYTGSVTLIPTVRNGSIRAQACFGHPILAGAFGATLAPLFYWLWRSGKGKAIALAGMLGSFMIVFFSASSTPVMAWVGGIGALLLWPIRRSMRAVRWGIVLTIAGLAIVMKAPVWFVIARVNILDGSGGWDRAFLIDTFIRHFRDWWLIGANQMAGWGGDMWDLSNQFVAEGETGGLLTFIFFIAIISRSFSRLGKMRRQVESDKTQEWFYWSLCAVLFAHILAYFGVSYWDQNQIWWFAFLAMISAATAALASSVPATEHVVGEPKNLESVSAGIA